MLDVGLGGTVFADFGMPDAIGALRFHTMQGWIVRWTPRPLPACNESCRGAAT